MFITPGFKKSLIVEQFQGNYLNNDNWSIVLIATGRLFHKSTMWLKDENLTWVLKRPLASMACAFLISYLYDLKLTYSKMSNKINVLFQTFKN